MKREPPQSRPPPRRGTTPAKIAPPRLPGVHARTRLFRELDRARRHPVIWLAAPAGYGKTTLVASYLEARKLPTLWVQLDEGDADIASFFHYLALAARRTAPRARWSLPDFTPEYFASLPQFARRTFEQLAARLPAHTVAVFDNYQTVPAGAALHEVLHSGFSQIPEGMTVLMISRHEPPPVYVTDRANGVMVVLGREELRLTEQESAGICRSRRPVTARATKGTREVARQLHQRAHGWAAGLVLLMEQGKAQHAPRAEPIDAPQEVLFDYFYRELFDKTSPETQQLLLSTAYLPMVSPAAAEALTENPHAGELLRQLHRDNFFTLLRGASSGASTRVFEYHPLLRDFLRAHAERLLSHEERSLLARRSAALLEQEGRIEDAVQLLQAVGDWDRLVALIKQHAPALLERGSHRTLSAWLYGLPDSVQEGDPWLLFWQGACRLPFDTQQARELFTRAFAEFRARSDAAGVFLAWASVVEAIAFEWDDFSQLDSWIAELDLLVAAFPAFPTPQIEARVVSGLCAALMFQQPTHPQIEHWHQRLEAIVAQIPDPSARVLVGNHLFVYQLVWLGELGAAERILLLLRPSRGAKLSPVAEIIWHTCFASLCAMSDRNDEGLATAATAQSVATEQGMTLWTFLANSAGVDIHLAQGDLDGAAPYLARLEQLLTPRRRIDQGHYVFYGAWTASLRGDYAAAKDKLFDCLALVGRGDNLQNCAVNLALAALHQKTEDPETALRHAQCALTLGAALRSPMMQYEALRLLAWIHLEQGRETEGLVYLSQAFALGRAKSFARLRYYFNDPGVFAKLCAFALEANLEVDYALALIREHKLLPPAAAPVAESWPLPVRIYTLGRFSLLRDGNAVTFAGKAQKKPLDLLKALIALGGRDVREDTLAGALWPDADGDDAAHSLTSTVHRLRTLMGPDAIVRQAGRLSLDPRQCWVDAWSFARGLTLLKQAERAQKLADSGSLGERLMQQYRGGFLANDVEHPWILQARERLHARFLRLLEATGAAHARAQRHELASACFQKAVEIDPLAEPAYRGLMQVSLIQGRHAEALATYKRCRKALRSGLGCAPSTETQALFSTLRGQPGRRREVPSR